MSNELVFTNDRKWPQFASKSTAATGGFIANGKYSYAVVAWYTLSETNLANAGVGRSVTGFNSLTTTGANISTVTLNWSRLPDNRTPHHYSIYFQTGDTFDYSAQCTKVQNAGVPGYLFTSTFGVHTPDGLPTFGAATQTVTLNPIMDMMPTFKPKAVKGFNGKHYRKSWASDTLTDLLEMRVTQMSTFKDADLAKAHSGATQLLSWLDNGVPLKLAEQSLAADVEEDPYIQNYYGVIVDFDYLASKGKNDRDEFMIVFSVESEDKV